MKRQQKQLSDVGPDDSASQVGKHSWQRRWSADGRMANISEEAQALSWRVGDISRRESLVSGPCHVGYFLPYPTADRNVEVRDWDSDDDSSTNGENQKASLRLRSTLASGADAVVAATGGGGGRMAVAMDTALRSGNERDPTSSAVGSGIWAGALGAGGSAERFAI